MPKLKVKSFLFLSLGLISFAAITPLCYSCSCDTNDIGGFDKKYGVNDAMVKRLEKQCIINYRSTLDEKGIIEPSEVQKKINSLKADIDNLIKYSKDNNHSFTESSNAIIELMSSQYDTKISREFNPSINFEDEIQDFKNTCINRITQKMNEEHISSIAIQTKLNSFEQGFNNIKSSLRGQYDDNLCYMNNLKTQCISLLDEINQELDQMAAVSTLKSFFDNYTFYINKDKLTNEDYWDKISKKYNDGANITQLLERIFLCYNKKEKKYIDNFKFDGTEKGGIIPNYIIIPICRGFTQDIYHNVHKIAIEFFVEKKSNFDLALKHKDENIFYNTAATNAALKDTSKAKEFNSQSELLKLSSDKKEFTQYELPISQNAEKEQLNAIFKNITFIWDKTGEDYTKGILYPNCKYEGFFGAINQKNGQILTVNQLADIGLCLKDKLNGSMIRLESIINNINANKDSSEFEQLPTYEKILRTIDIYSITNIVDDQTHEVTNKIYIAYKYSNYVNLKDISKEDHGGFIEFCDANCIGMPISRELYKNSLKDFANANNAVRYYDNGHGSKQFINETKEALIPQIVICVAVGLALIIETIAFIVSSANWLTNISHKAKILRIITIIVLTVCNVTVIAVTSIFSIKVIKPAQTFDENVTKLLQNENFKKFSRKVNDDFENIYKSYDIFKNLPFLSVVKPTIVYYKNLSAQQDFINFEMARLNSNTDYDTFKKENQKQYKLFCLIQIPVAITACIAAVIIGEVAERLYQKGLKRKMLKFNQKITKLTDFVSETVKNISVSFLNFFKLTAS